MDNAMKINDEVTVGPQPSEIQVEQLCQQGFKTIINFRTEGEEEQPLSPQAEGEKVKAAGMEYLHIPAATESMEDAVGQFRTKCAGLSKPVFAHCKTGRRAGAIVMIHVSCEHGMSGEQTLEKPQEMGFECDEPELIEFAKSYVDTHGN